MHHLIQDLHCLNEVGTVLREVNAHTGESLNALTQPHFMHHSLPPAFRGKGLLLDTCARL